MINPVSGGTATEAEVRVELDRWRRLLLSYASLDRETGGVIRTAENVIELEKALKDADMKHTDAEMQFLQRNNGVKWNSGVPTWDFWDLVDGDWEVTTYEVSVDLTNPRVRTELKGNY